MQLIITIIIKMEEYYTRYYNHQIGGGSGENQFLQLHIPRVYQRGVGSIFSSFWRFLQPLLKKGASFASKELLETGADIISGIAAQKPLKNIVADRSIQIVDKIRDKAATHIKSMAGSGTKRKHRRQSIKGKQKKKFNHSVGHRQPVKKKNSNTKKNKIIKPRILDIFS